MKKRILALILCALVMVASVPLSPYTDIFSVVAVAADVETLSQIFAQVPSEDKWGDYSNGDSLKDRKSVV